ncbi:MAG: hypothetical protein E7673_03650 [Ruminococcaceae bacterium]|nr:hypothetical protein [Oscillospiraceae bacterium]
MKETEILIYDQNIWGCTRGSDVIANRCRLVAELIDYHDADVIAFQECSKAARNSDDGNVAKLLSPVYEEVPHNAEGNNFTPVFYKTERFSVLESGYVLYERQRPTNSKSITYAVFEDKENGVRFGILSAHFWWKVDSAEDDNIRLYNAQLLGEYAEKIKEKYDIPVFLMGDFNCGTNSSASITPYLYLKDKFLDLREVAPISTDALTQHEYPTRNSDGAYTADWRLEAESGIDHIFVTEHRSVAIDSFEIDESDEAYASSDHYPLIARARIFGG